MTLVNRYGWTLLHLAVILFGLACYVTVLQAKAAVDSVRASGTIVGSYQTTTRGSGRASVPETIEWNTIQFWSSDGRSFTFDTSESINRQLDGSVRVLYDPSDPASACLDAGRPWFIGWNIMFFAAAFLAELIGGINVSRRSLHRSSALQSTEP